MVFMLTFSLMFLLAACSSAESESTDSDKEDSITLSYAFFAPAETLPAQVVKKWSEELESRTNGKVNVEIFYGGSLLQADNMFEGIENGVADMGMTLPSYEPKRFPLLEIADLAQYPNAEVSSKVIYDLEHEYPPEALDNFKFITSFATEPNHIASVDPIKSLEDLKDKQIRISGSLIPMLEKFGASPVGLPQNEVPEALQTGIIEGNVSSREVLMDMKLAEITKYVTEYPFSIANFVVVMNQEKWNSLPEDVQEIIDELGEEMSVYAGKGFDDHVEKALKWSVEEEDLKILKLSEEETEKWNKISKKAREDAVKRAEDKNMPGEEYSERIDELIKKHSQDE